MAPNPNLHDLSRLPPEYDDIIALSDALFRDQQPITTAILGAVMVELHLERLVRSKLKHKDDETWALLVADNGHLGSFYSQIAMGYAFGIYDKDMCNDLNIVRNIRNTFAHSKKSIKFEHPAVVAELGKATTSAKNMCKSIGPDAMRYKSLCFYLSTKLVRMYEPTKYDLTPDYVKALLSGML